MAPAALRRLESAVMRRRPRGSGTIRKEGAGFSLTIGRWPNAIYEAGFRTKAEAEARATLLRTETIHRRLGIAADPRLTPTLGELATDWLTRRKATHAAGAEDGSRWRKHLEPAFGHLRPDELDDARIRAFVESKRRTKRQAPGARAPKDGKLAPGTLRVVIAVLSSLYEDLLERKLATRNPARHLPKSLLRLVRSDHDPKTTPFVERLADVRRIFIALEEPLSVAYAIGAFAGLRTGEVFALRWTSVDLDARRILVSESVKGGVKDKEPRLVPIQDSLLPVLKAWKVKSGGSGLVIPPLREDGEHVDKSTPASKLRPVLSRLGLPPLEPKPWYQATRHTFASHWAMAGGSLRELQTILGHASITETERYAHLVPGYFSDGARSTFGVDLSPAGGSVAEISRDSAMGGRPSTRKNKRKAGAAL
jgi:integrase